jgi:hypothetical protein
MRSEERPASKGRAPRSGMNAVQPPDYGSRVRSLLGMPPQGSAGPAGHPILPPVGFRYAGQPHVTTLPYGTEAVESAWGDKPGSRQVAVQPTATWGESGPDRGRVGAERPHPGRQAAAKETNEDSVVLETVTSHVADAPRPGAEPATTPEGIDTTVGATSVQIPGVSDEPRSFVAHSPATPGRALAGLPEARSRPGVPEMGLGETSATPLRPEPQTTAAPEIATGVAAADTVSPAAPLPPASPGGKPGANPDVRSSTVAARPPEPYTPPGAYRDACERIEQLREAVRQLTAKVASRSVATDRETQPAQPPPPPPPPQPIVIVNRVSRQGRRPRAFWERRYLGHHRLRALR